MTSQPSATLSELPTPETVDLYSLFSLPLGSELVSTTLQRACELEGLSTDLPEPVIAAYPDMTFHSYHSLGLSLGFSPPLAPTTFPSTSSPQPQLILTQIDLFNPPTDRLFSSTTSKPTFSACLETLLPHPLKRDSTARGLILDPLLGEPSRKGGGEANLGRLGLGVWMEWEWEGSHSFEASKGVGNGVEGGEQKKGKRGLKVEFEEKGPGCWERERLDQARWKEAGLFVC